ncbi:MAG: fluoride efflux transporter CrcB [Clostridiales bacterium]|nr:fluoride efflux transporter CrcB [Clostridiales bacterium]
MFNCLAVGAGGFIGSIFRYLIGLIPLFHKGDFPFHTLIINVVGAVVIGMLVKGAEGSEALSETTMLFLKIGLCGGFTTFSTFSLEALGLLESGKSGLFALYIVASVCLCIAGVFCGKWIMGVK